MSLSQDLELILDVVRNTDPSFTTVDPEKISAHFDDVQRHASQNASDGFLLSAMRLLALSGNGHTRLIPNDAISVLPFRFVTIGTSVFLTKTSDALADIAPSKLIAVNDVAVETIERAAASFLAGTGQRKRVIGPLLFAWPSALAHLGCGPIGPDTSYQLQSADGRKFKVKVSNDETVLASEFYPRNEHGKIDPVWDFDGFAETHAFSENGLAVKLPSFFDPDKSAFPEAIDRATARVQLHCGGLSVFDVRGNTGGDFLAAMPLIDAITGSAQERGCAVLVDKFTFSAAIVFVAILKYRLGEKLKIVGEEMGDGLRFFAEGGLIELPTSGAHVRYSSAHHDWETGVADRTTPPEIAQQMVPVNRLEVDRYWFASPFDTPPRDTLYERLVEDLA